MAVLGGLSSLLSALCSRRCEHGRALANLPGDSTSRPALGAAWLGAVNHPTGKAGFFTAAPQFKGEGAPNLSEEGFYYGRSGALRSKTA